MGWQEGYLQASFRGAQFHVRTATSKGGRRTVDHVYPRSDVVERDNLGASPRDFSLDAYVIGPRYFEDRDKFERALEQGGIGLLVHPYRGSLNVKVLGDWTAVETSEEGGMVRYTLTFGFEKKLTATKSTPDTKWRVRTAKADILRTAKSNFLDIFDLAQAPANAVRDARAALDKGLSVIDSAKRIAGSAADFKRQIENTRGRLEAVMYNLEYLVDSFTALIDWGVDEAATPRDQLRELKEVASFADAVIGDTTINTRDSHPVRQVQMLVKQLAVAGQIGIVSETPFTSAEDAAEVRGELLVTLTDIMASPATSDDLYAALADGKQAAFEDVEARIVTLPRVLDLTLPYPDNTLSLMYAYFGDLKDEQDFIDRNGIVHPGFLPTGQPLKLRLRDAS